MTPQPDSPYVTRSELDEAIEAVKKDIQDTEIRLRREWTDTVRYEIQRVTDHLTDQDGKIDKVLWGIIGLLVTVVGSLIYVALSGHIHT